MQEGCITLQKKRDISHSYVILPGGENVSSEKSTNNEASSNDIKEQYRKVAISTLDKCIDMLRYTKAVAVHNSLWHCGCSFVDGRRKK